MINVPKWPRVTGRPSPVTALKRGHLQHHLSQRYIWTFCKAFTVFAGIVLNVRAYVFRLN